MQDNLTHCAALVREADRDRYLATLFAPADRRDALLALYAFNIEISRIRDVAREPMPGEIRLQWWREVLEGSRDSEALAHPVAAALRETLSRYAISPERLMALIDAHQFDLYDEPMATLDEFDRYAMLTEAALFEIAAEILGVRAEGLGGLGGLTRPAGIAYAVRSALTDIAPHATLGDLRQHGLENLSAARVAAESVPPHALPALLPMATVGPELRRLERGADDTVRVQPLSRLRRQWLIWRAARNPRRIFA